jgi:Glyoxalase/Bleomycin resistance protein/Dioxygenase superfamily
MKTTHLLSINGLHHVSLRVRGMDKSLSFYLDVLGFLPKTTFLLDGLRVACSKHVTTSTSELVETNQPMEPVGESEVFRHLALRTDHLEKSLQAAVNVSL